MNKQLAQLTLAAGSEGEGIACGIWYEAASPKCLAINEAGDMRLSAGAIAESEGAVAIGV